MRHRCIEPDSRVRPADGWIRGLRSVVTWLFCVALPLGAAAPAQEALNGLPITRAYSFDDIGDISRGARLAFDQCGRIVAVQDGALLALNDNEWINLAAGDSSAIRVQSMARDVDGSLCYGGQGSCGLLVRTDRGGLRPESVLPTPCPSWVTDTSFMDIVCRPEGVYFGGVNGVVFWDRVTRTTSLLEIPDVASLFTLDDAPYISTHSRGVLSLGLRAAKATEADKAIFGGNVIDHAARLTTGRTIVSTTGRRLYFYDGAKVTPLPGPLGGRLEGRIDALVALANGEAAAAITGKGLFILSPAGEITTALTSAEYRRINALATNEPGVLWMANETGILRILHGTPLTWFGQSLGLSVGWPQVVPWNGSVVIASNGRLYEPFSGPTGEPTHFRLIEGQPGNGTWGIATFSDWLLAANFGGVFGCRPGKPFEPLFRTMGAARLVMLKSGVCFAVDTHAISALRFESGAWKECAPRVAGIGYPSVTHAAANSAWVEIGANRVARLALKDGKIETRIFDSFPWRDPAWVNVSIVDDTVVLSGPEPERLYFDERTESFTPHPPLQATLEAAPFWPARIERDDTGTYWLSHAHGVTTLTLHDGGRQFDTQTYRPITDHTPLVQTLPGPDVWISRGNSLYHVTHAASGASGRSFAPLIVSVRDARANIELLEHVGARMLPRALTYRQNGISVRLFAGGYALKRSPAYEYRLNGSAWSGVGANSLLSLSDLREGTYDLEVRLIDDTGPLAAPTSFHFAIAPPWYRTWIAYAVELVVLGLAILLTVRVSLQRARRRNAELEQTVAERTEELKATMEKLQQETRTAATLAERNRLAGEIHDSLEQGFSGLLLHLETTSSLADCPPRVQGALTVARNMVAFSRNEVRHAVWDLHSPLLDSGGLETALKNIVAQVGVDTTKASVTVVGEFRRLGSTLEHHLLRIAQEAIANAVKHSSATHLDITLTFTEAELDVTVQDDGRGFDPQAVLAAPAGHFGLRSLRGRAAKIGGALEIDSKPGRGTRVTVRVPLRVNPAI